MDISETLFVGGLITMAAALIAAAVVVVLMARKKKKIQTELNNDYGSPP